MSQENSKASRHQYRLWLKDPIPKPPKSTACRYKIQENKSDQMQFTASLKNNDLYGECSTMVATCNLDPNSSFNTVCSPSDEMDTVSALSSLRSDSVSDESDSGSTTFLSIDDSTEDSEGHNSGAFDNPDNLIDNKIKFIIGGKKFMHLEEEIFLNARRTNLTATATEDLWKLVNCLLNNEFILQSICFGRYLEALTTLFISIVPIVIAILKKY